MGIDYTAYAKFNEQFSLISAPDFVKQILVDKLKVFYVFTGEDFRFGNKSKGQGDSKLLGELAKKYGFGYSAIEKIVDENGERYSSTRARIAIRNGDVAGAANIMGRNFVISGTVKRGSAKGRDILGVATANIGLDSFVIPRFGVYCCKVRIRDEKYDAIANIGIRPTMGNDTAPQLEAHIFDFDKDIYGKLISVELISFIREEKKFGSVDELKAQIEKDIISCKTR
jgi:riboflavin kinase/FMN adenylyltransferase